MISTTVVACIKYHGLLGIDEEKMNLTKLINSIKEGKNIGLLRGYRTRIYLKENHYLNYMEARKLPIHTLSMVKENLKKLIQQKY